jgi:hypothetical protein
VEKLHLINGHKHHVIFHSAIACLPRLSPATSAVAENLFPAEVEGATVDKGDNAMHEIAIGHQTAL